MRVQEMPSACLSIKRCVCILSMEMQTKTMLEQDLEDKERWDDDEERKRTIRMTRSANKWCEIK